MRTSRTRHRIEAAVAVFGTIAAVYGVSRLIAPSKTASASVVRTESAPLPPPPVIPRVDPALDPTAPSLPPSPAADLTFAEAVKAGDVEKAKGLYRADDDVHSVLRPAVETGKAALVAWLLDLGADPNRDGALLQSLRQCAENDGIPSEDTCSSAVTRALVTKGATVAEEDVLAALGARASAQGELLDVLVSHAPKKTLVDVLASRHLPADKNAIRKIAAVSGFRAADGKTETLPLFAAMERGDAAVAEALLEAGAPAAQTNHDGKTALIAALDDVSASDEQFHLVKALLARGADVNKIEPGGDTPLVKGVNTGDVRVVVALLESGARINHGLAERDASSTALEIAEQSGDTKIARYLLTRGAKRRPIPKAIDD